MFKFEIGQEVYVIHRVKNSKGVNKWHIANGKRKILDIKDQYIFEQKPLKAKEKDVFETYEEEENQCEYSNYWGKYHKNINFRGRRKKK